MKFNVVIIGAGNIGALYDLPDSNGVLTHAHAFREHKGFNLLGFVDTDIEKATQARSRWGGQIYSSIDDAYGKAAIDIACICVPDRAHYGTLQKLHRHSQKLVFTEKPLAINLHEAQEIVALYGEGKISVAVNYSRRYVPEFDEIRKQIIEGSYGKFLHGVGYYGKGLLHNGSHLVDLLCFFFGKDIHDVIPIGSVDDYYPDDKSVSGVIRFRDSSYFVLQCVDCNHYTVFEVDLLFEKKRIRITDLGAAIEEYDILENQVYPGYRNIVKVKHSNTSLDKALYYSADNIYLHLTQGEPLKCTMQDGYRTLEVCMKIRECYG
jgi:predicted dehydrogenase